LGPSLHQVVSDFVETKKAPLFSLKEFHFS
jgi:hypothetical protein